MTIFALNFPKAIIFRMSEQICVLNLNFPQKFSIVQIRYLFYFPPIKKYLKIEFSIIEERANNSTIIKYKLLRDKWIIDERVGKLSEVTTKTWSEFPEVRTWKRNLSGRVTGNNWKRGSD